MKSKTRTKQTRTRGATLEKLAKEQVELLAPFSDQFASVRPKAERMLQVEFSTIAKRLETRRQQAAGYQKAGMEPLLRQLLSDEQYRAGLDSFTKAGDMLELDISTNPNELLFAKQFAVSPLTSDPMIVVIIGASEETLDFFALPFAGQSSVVEGGTHQQQTAFADRTTGRFGFVHTIGHEGGSSYCASALWVDFMRRGSPGAPPGHGNPGLAQVRPFVPYSYAWRDISYIAPAHNHAGFGIFVVSSDLDGGDEIVEQNHQYWIFSDGTSWYQDHNNPAFPEMDREHAFTFDHAAPHFIIRPGRFYSAAVWCFGSCDAHGATWEQASFAQAAVVANTPFIVVGQSKN